MADRYWVGGTANWDGTAGTKWATTSGGAGGASSPTAGDDVFFTNLSTGTCTIAAGYTGAKSINCTGFTGTLAGSVAIIVSGSITLSAGMTYTFSGAITLDATATINSAGKTFGAIVINGTGITVTLGSDITLSSSITLSNGTFTTANFNIVATQFISVAANTRVLNLGSSTLTLSGTSAFNLVGSIAALTINAGTSTINATGSNAQITTGDQLTPAFTLYNVNYTNTGANNAHILSGGFTVQNLSVTAPSSAGFSALQFSTPVTISGTLSTTGTAGNRRVWFRGTTYGLAQTLTINSAPSLTDADFRDIYVIGTAAPISGTRVGDLRGCRGITFSTPKTVYWNLVTGGSWSDNAWAASSGGAVSTDNFPLAQDTAVIQNTGLNTSATISTLSSGVPLATSTLDASTRTSAMTLSFNASTYYGDLKLGSGVTPSGSSNLTFSGRNTQTITSAGKTVTCTIIIDSYGGSVELSGPLNISFGTITVTNGTFDTKNFDVTAATLSSGNSNVRAITLGSSTVTLSGSSPISFSNNTNLTFNAGTSQLTLSAANVTILSGGTVGVSFYNVTLSSDTGNSTHTISSANTFNNLTITAPSSASVIAIRSDSPQTITGTLTVAGATAVRRIFVRSNTIGTQRAFSVGTLSANNCDFRDIAITGTAAGSSPTRAGDCGGNSGITFPAGKTVYWNLAGTQQWSATAWAPSSGGTPDINQFPLAQDTAVFDNTGAVGTVTIQAAWNIGGINMSGRTTACTIDWSNGGPFIYGDVLLGSGVTPGTIGTSTLAKRGTQTITSAGNTWSGALTVDSATGVVQLADALTLISARIITLTTGTFDAVSYNVTVGRAEISGSNVRTLKMGSGTWTLTSTGTVWSLLFVSSLIFYKGTANIVLSDTSTGARSFDGGALSYNKLTIGGATGTSTLTINSNNQFTELASTKTVAHTIALGSTVQTFGKWTVTGTAGNVVTLTGTGTSHIIAGACTDGIDYLAMGSIGFASASPGEFYAGANSTGTAGAPVYRTAKPADSTRYWVGGTGNWSDTARWSTSSGGASGASVPRSHDDVVFDSASNATAYTATVNTVTGGIRTKALTIAGPAAGNVTLAGTAAMNGIHGNVTLPATGLTWSYTGNVALSGSTTGKTFTTNGVSLSTFITINGVGCGWTLGFNLTAPNGGVFVTNGTFDTSTYNITTGEISSNNINGRTITFGSGTMTLTSLTFINFGTTETTRAGLVFNAGTSQINSSFGIPTLAGNNQTFYNVSFTDTSSGTNTISGVNSFNNLTFAGPTANNTKLILFNDNQTVTGTFTCSAGADATARRFIQSNTLGTPRTLTCAAVSLTDVDFRDITIAGAAAPATGTRLGDCKGNSGITFTAAANKYWNLAAGGTFSGTAWATTSGGTPAANNFPLAQDTCIFEATGLNSGATVTISGNHNIGTIDMAARTANTMTLTLNGSPIIYSNWINGTGTTLSGTGTITFAGRGSQTLTSAGKTFTQPFNINSPGGTVTLQDAFTCSRAGSTAFVLTSGTLNANTFNFTLSAATSAFDGSNSNTRTISFGSGTWTLAGSSAPWAIGTSTNLTVTGTGTITLTSASAKTFVGGGVSYTNITLNQGGAGTLTITGNNTFKDITNTYKATGATTINMGTTTQRVSQWTAAGEAGRLLTIQGTSASSPCTLVHTGTGTAANVNYLVITGVRAY